MKQSIRRLILSLAAVIILIMGVFALPTLAEEQFTEPMVIEDGNTVLALKSDGTVWAWGLNSNGQVGVGSSNIDIPAPTQVKGIDGTEILNNVISITTSGTTTSCFALLNNRTVASWGFNMGGSLGDGTTTDKNTPVMVKGPDGEGYLTDVAKIIAYSSRVFALKTDGTVWAWGSNNINNRYQTLGVGSTANHITYPTQVLGIDGIGFLADIVDMITYDFMVYALKADGSVVVWGYNNFNHAGIPDASAEINYPTIHPGLTDIKQLGEYIALKKDGTILTWGQNQNAQLGNGQINDHSEYFAPALVPDPNGEGYLQNVADINIAGSQKLFHLIKKSDGTIWLWGNNSANMFDQDINTQENPITRPVKITVLNEYEKIYTTASPMFGIKTDGTVWVTGSTLYQYENNNNDDPTATETMQVFQIPGEEPFNVYPIPRPAENPIRCWLEIPKGASENLLAVALPDEWIINPASWSSENSGVASVAADGTVTALSPGVSVITAQTLDGLHKADIGVLVTDGDITAIRLEVKLILGKTVKFTATDINGQIKTDAVVWNSSNETAIGVDTNGRVSGITAGLSVITATTPEGEFIHSFYVRVENN